MKTHVARVVAKLGRRDRVQAVVHAYEKRAGVRRGVSGRAGQPASASGARSAASAAGGCRDRTTSEALAPVASIDFFTVEP